MGYAVTNRYKRTTNDRFECFVYNLNVGVPGTWSLIKSSYSALILATNNRIFSEMLGDKFEHYFCLSLKCCRQYSTGWRGLSGQRQPKLSE